MVSKSRFPARGRCFEWEGELRMTDVGKQVRSERCPALRGDLQRPEGLRAGCAYTIRVGSGEEVARPERMERRRGVCLAGVGGDRGSWR